MDRYRGWLDYFPVRTTIVDQWFLFVGSSLDKPGDFRIFEA
jgi:hypothetical protein